MHRSKLFIWLTILLLCVVLSAAAVADSALSGLWNSGCDLLFHTDNVTVTGEATFSLNGERFKTLRLNYVQDGYCSFYGLKLLTPRWDGSERETGWTIIADEEGNYAVMEAYRPGVYWWGVDFAQNTLLRRTVQLDALTELGGLMAAQVEPLLPKGALTVTEADGLRTVRIALTRDQIPEVAVSALNLAAGYLAGRWFPYGNDRAIHEDEALGYEYHVTPTEALMDGTVHWALRGVDAEFVTDAQGRLTAVRGSLQAESTYWDGVVREIEVEFDFAATDYGTSHVKPFDPNDYGVVLATPWAYEEYEGGEETSYSYEEPWDEDWDVGTAALPAYVYPGDDPVEAAVADYTSALGTRCRAPEGSASVPAPVILKTQETEDGRLLVYGNFWYFNYVLKGRTLQCVSGGVASGIMTLEKTGDGWAVLSLEEAGDGEFYARDIRRLSGGDAELEQMYIQTPYYDARLRFLEDYVAANGLDARAYKDPGCDPEPLTASPGQTITALAIEIDPEQLSSVTVNARITDYLADENALAVELIVPEAFDGEDVRYLTVGDAVYTQGQEIVVETLREVAGYLVVNEGDFEFSEGSVWFCEQEDGTYLIAEWGDNTWTTVANMKIPVDDGLMFLDWIDPSSGEPLNLPSTHTGAEFISVLQSENEEGGPGFAANNVLIVFDGEGNLSLIQRFYVPWQ